MSARWYKRCGADFIHGTMMLSLEEKGAYSLCLDLIYDRGGPIPDDARWLSGVCGVSIRKWNAIRDHLLLLGKLYAENGLLSNARADFELVSAELSSRERAESGAKGGRKRAENAGQAKQNSDLGQAELKREEKIREEVEVVEATPQPVRARAWPCPEGVDPQHWRDFLANRKTKRLTNSETARIGVLADIERLTDDAWPPGKLVELAARKGWGSINPPHGNGHHNGNQRPANDPNEHRNPMLLALEQRRAAEAGGRYPAGN